MAKIKVQDTEVTVVKVKNEDYFCLTDMVKAKEKNTSRSSNHQLRIVFEIWGNQ